MLLYDKSMRQEHKDHYHALPFLKTSTCLVIFCSVYLGRLTANGRALNSGNSQKNGSHCRIEKYTLSRHSVRGYTSCIPNGGMVEPHLKGVV